MLTIARRPLILAQPSLRSALAGAWPLHEESGTRQDYSGLGSHMAQSGGVSQAAGQVGFAASLASGSSQYMSTAQTAKNLITDSFTVSGWFRAASNSGGGLVMVASYDSLGAGAGFGGNNWVLYDVGFDAGAVYRLTLSNAAGSAETTAQSGGSTHINTWHFVVGWYDAVAATNNIQVDNGTAVSTAHTGGIRTASVPLYIGAQHNGGAPNGFYDGRVNIVLLHKRVLSDTERTNLYLAGQAGVPAFAT